MSLYQACHANARTDTAVHRAGWQDTDTGVRVETCGVHAGVGGRHWSKQTQEVMEGGSVGADTVYV